MTQMPKGRPLSFWAVFVLATFTTLPLNLCRNLHPSSTTLLDITSSLRQARNVLSSKPRTTPLNHQQEEEEEEAQHTSSSIVLQLHPRASIGKPQHWHHTDYRSLTLARLARDTARVKSLASRLDLALNRISKSDLKPVDLKIEQQQQYRYEYGVQGIQGPVVSGTSQGSGEYFSRVGIGDPPNQLYMVIDTGSDVNWVQCSPCADCYRQADPIFDPASSSSFSPLTCDTSQCRSLDVSECHNGTCLYEVSYGDGSYTVGDLVTETVTLGSTKIDNVVIGCGHNNEGLFIGAAGLLGLGGGSLSFPSQLKATSFSYCLVDRDSDSSSTIEFDSSLPPDVVTAPLLRNPQMDTFLYVGMTGLSVGGDLLPLSESLFRLDGSGNGGIIVDSGTAITRLQTDVYNSLRDAFSKGTRGLPRARGFDLFDTCYDLSTKSSVEVPTVSFHFGEGKELPLPAKNYMIPIDSNGTFCLAFAPTSSAPSIIGNVQQQGTRVGFDLASSVIGFVPNKC
ncbi:hypothetical protein SAY87_005301 [Trapa incisa]|uniref:Peptidase A1 domain-containing protein n=1 Tax=Trapa incisa TaxID=236973 RepID=A0AAN7K2P6_9MYRT|nr:hypothetical protein SAY87_005301 [Trapa incisa]